jgi:hypothetical protein
METSRLEALLGGGVPRNMPKNPAFSGFQALLFPKFLL